MKTDLLISLLRKADLSKVEQSIQTQESPKIACSLAFSFFEISTQVLYIRIVFGRACIADKQFI